MSPNVLYISTRSPKPDINNHESSNKTCTDTILYCILSMVAPDMLAHLSNSEILRPTLAACLDFMIGCNCLWSPISTTWVAWVADTMGTILSGSIHIPHSSIITLKKYNY